MMFRNNATRFLIVIFILTIIGCSGGPDALVAPAPPDDTGIEVPGVPRVENIEDSSRNLWGIWTVLYDPESNQVNIVPVRMSEFHVDITDMILPPACDDCFEIAVNGFDLVTRILDADVTLRNPYPISGKDVRGILFTNDYGHLLTNPDDWTGLWDTPGGSSLNPFKAFAKGEANRIFAGGSEHSENYLVYIPLPPAYFAITFAVDASWPGNCKEPYTIDNFTQVDDLFDFEGAYATLTVDVLDWQDDVSKVTLVAPEITGQSFTPFTYDSGNTWTLELVNNETAPVGDYELRIIADSTNSPGVPLYDFVSVSILHAVQPTVTGIDPDNGISGYLYEDVNIFGDNFEGPDIQVKLKKDGEPDIIATDVQYTLTTFTCDIDIPFIAAPGLYDVEVINGTGAWDIGEELFEITLLIPDVTGIIPDNGPAGSLLTDAIITGSNFQGPGVIVKLKKTGEPDIDAVVNSVQLTTISCDIDIPFEAAQIFYDVEVTNGNGQVGTGADLFEVEHHAPTAPVNITPPDLNFAPGGMWIDGNYMYTAGSQNGLHIWDVTNPDNPQWISKVDPHPDFASTYQVDCNRVAASGGYAYVSVRADEGEYVQEYYLIVVDVDPPESAYIETYYEVGESIGEIAANGSTVYYTDWTNGLTILDASTPGTPTFVKSVPMATTLERIFFDNNYIYAAVGLNGMHIIDVFPPEDAYVVKTFTSINQVLGVTVTGGYAYAGCWNAVHIIDIDPPESASVVKTIDYSPTYGAKYITIDDGYAYLKTKTGIDVIDVDPIASASIIHSVNTNDDVLNMSVKGDYLYAHIGRAGISILDISDPATTSIYDGIYTPGDPRGIAYDNNALFVPNGKAGVMGIDVSIPDAPQVMGLADTNGVAAYIAADGGYAYNVAYFGSPTNALHILDPDPLADLFIQKTVSIPGHPGSLEAGNGYAYATSGDASSLYIYDVIPPESASLVKTVGLTGYYRDTSLDQGYFYISNSNSTVDIIDVDPFADAIIIKTFALANLGNDIDVQDGYAFITSGSGYLMIADIDPPGDASVVKTVILPSSPDDIAVQGGYAYIAAEDYAEGYLVVVDIDPIADSYVLTEFDTMPYGYYGIAVNDNIAYLRHEDGVHIFELW